MHHNLIKYLNNIDISVRLATNDLNISNWNRWNTTPVNGYLDIGNEPIKIDEINYIEIDCLKDEFIGKIMPSKKTLLTKEVETYLTTSNYKYKKYDDRYIQIYLNSKTS
ncbi:MAG: hypothetical protein RIS29_3185 [Bacteroidota bacterium]|jgi:hypothetical protein